MSLEKQRNLLEELNLLEVAASQRFRRNPGLRAAANIRRADEVLENKSKRPHRETLMQQHELQFFHKQYLQNAERCRKLLDGESSMLEIKAMQDPEMKFANILVRINDIDLLHRGAESMSASSFLDEVSMFLSAPKDESEKRMKSGKVKRKYHLARATEHLNETLKLLFNEAELYGRYVDLTLFYEMYKTLLSSQQTYADYLMLFHKFEGCHRTQECTRYLENLLSYLKGFHERVFSLSTLDLESTPEVGPEQQAESGKVNDKGEVFCEACDKLFAKESVYQGHLSGKRHKKNAEKMNGSLGSAALPATERPPNHKSSQNYKTLETHKSSPNYKTLETHIQTLAAKLKPIIDRTIGDYQRRARFSERELELEKIAVEGELSDYTNVDSDSAAERSDDDDDDDLDEAYSKDLPLGSDGVPIPLWLYKLQGLHRTYLCEVCGNVSYKGRQQFNKHFGSPKHVHGLMCLGVLELYTTLFANISTIAGVEELWNTLKAKKGPNAEEDENAVEVEDDEGNVMSRKDYEELKKQGLI